MKAKNPRVSRLSTAIEQFIQDVRISHAHATAAAYKSDLKGIAVMAPGFTPEAIHRSFVVLSERGLRASSLHRKRAALSAFGRWGIEHKLWVHNPVEAAPKIRRQTTLPRPFPRDEIVRLWALALPPEERLLRALLYYSGLRITPICGIRLSDLSLDPPTIRTIGKGSRPFVVQMHPDLTELLIEHLQARTTPNGDAPLLMRPNGRPFTKRYAEDRKSVV